MKPAFNCELRYQNSVVQSMATQARPSCIVCPVSSRDHHCIADLCCLTGGRRKSRSLAGSCGQAILRFHVLLDFSFHLYFVFRSENESKNKPLKAKKKVYVDCVFIPMRWPFSKVATRYGPGVSCVSRIQYRPPITYTTAPLVWELSMDKNRCFFKHRWHYHQRPLALSCFLPFSGRVKPRSLVSIPTDALLMLLQIDFYFLSIESWWIAWPSSSVHGKKWKNFIGAASSWWHRLIYWCLKKDFVCVSTMIPTSSSQLMSTIASCMFEGNE